jgi:Tfp pilus assembly protein PilV
MMRTFFATVRSGRNLGRPLHRRLWSRSRSSEDGFLLIEVMVSSLIVAVIVIATLTGFDVANRTTADERNHDQAAVLAAQSEAQLRTDPASALVALESSPHKYQRTLGTTTYTITQEAKPLVASGQAATCNATEAAAQTTAPTPNVKISSSVTWPRLVSAKRPAVTAASIVTPPIGSAVEVDVLNGASPPGGVAGVTAVVTYTPLGSSTSSSQEGTTGSGGCVVFAGIQATSVTVAIDEKSSFITPGGALHVPSKEVTIAPNLTTHYPVTYNEGGKVTAQFTYKGALTYEREAGKPSTLETVTGDTFVVFNPNINIKPNFEVGSAAAFEYVGSEEEYKVVSGTYGPTATTAAGPKYLAGRLFPFSASPWPVYAGDCPKNNVGAEAASSEPPTVAAGTTSTVKVPLSYLMVDVYSGTASSPGKLESTPYPVTIKNIECEAEEAAVNSAGANLLHTQMTSAEGHLAHPFQPFGQAELCVFNGTLKRTYRHTYTKKTTNPAEEEIKVYMGQVPLAESKAKRESEEAATRAPFETKEAEERAKWEKEEKETKITKAEREAKEKTAETKALWERQRGKGEITTAQREAKEKTKATLEKEEKEGKITKTKREEREKEKETKALWEREEGKGEITKAQREAKEKTKATLEQEEKELKLTNAERKAKETTQTTARTKREGEEAPARTKREGEETAEAAQLSVEGGASSC